VENVPAENVPAILFDGTPELRIAGRPKLIRFSVANIHYKSQQCLPGLATLNWPV